LPELSHRIAVVHTRFVSF